MSIARREQIATLELSASCLQEAVERLQRLCRALRDSQHQHECTETARYISSQVTMIQEQVAVLRAEL